MIAGLDIDQTRLAATLDAINGFGRDDATGGFNRPAFSDADMAVRQWFLEEMNRDGLAAHWDGAGNVIGRLDAPGHADAPSIMVGSHLDTVVSGGAFDGALGCAVALECVRAIRAQGVALKHPIEVVATADEEGRFGGMLGSQALVGAASAAWIDSASDAQGVRLVDAMRAKGLDPAAIGAAARRPQTVRAFLELHVEQGPCLEAWGKPVGIATGASGVCVLEVTLVGTANHSGTTPMDMRADAFQALARIGTALEAMVARRGTAQSRLTIGHVRLEPNAVHTIAGRATFTIVLRDMECTIVDALEAEARVVIEDASRNHRCTATVTVCSRLDPVSLDPDLIARVRASARHLGLAAAELPSGAGHDAQTMAALCPSALIFVPSRAGISHAPEEFTAWPDIVAGARLLLATLAVLAAGE